MPPRLLLAGVLATLPSVSALSQSGATPAPEDPALLQQVRGTLVMTKPVGGIVAVDLPSLQTRDLRLNGHGHKAINDLSGPDADGRVAFVISGGGLSPFGVNHKYAVHLEQPDGTDQELFTGPGDPLWDHAISPLALSPRGGNVAFVAQPRENQDRHFQRLINGPLRYWDARSKAVRDLGITAVAQRPAWFPDGRRLAYVAPAAGSSPQPYFGPRENEPHLPVVHIVDTESGADSVLAKGHFPLVSSDGQSVLVERYRGRFVLIDVASKKEQSLPGLGAHGHPVALIGSRYVIVHGRPNPGMPTGETSHNSPLVGPKATEAVKLVDLQGNASVTLIPVFDPRLGLSAFVAPNP